MQEGIVLVAVMIIVEVIKKVSSGKYSRFLPMIALILGIVAQVIYAGATIENIFTGILIGGAAAGVYDFVNKTLLSN